MTVAHSYGRKHCSQGSWTFTTSWSGQSGKRTSEETSEEMFLSKHHHHHKNIIIAILLVYVPPSKDIGVMSRNWPACRKKQNSEDVHAHLHSY